MSAVIRLNGTEIPQSRVMVDLTNGKAEFDCVYRRRRKLDFNKVYIEVNIFGEVEMEE